jgi:methionine sulfoxide reductase heme-binding subunit
MSLEWFVIRGSGLTAYTLLAASVIWGLVLSLGVLPENEPKLTSVHETLSVGALLATLVHVTGIALGGFLDFDASAILVPGRAPWRAVAVACGVVAFYGMLVVILSFPIRNQIGRATWRALHYLSFAVFLAVLIHGVTAGTDTSSPVVFALYVASAAAVSTLVILRILRSRAPTPGDRPGPARARPRTGRVAAPDPGRDPDADTTLELPAVHAGRMPPF